jgi:hypothetical protein
MAQKLPIPVLAGNSYEISSLSLTTSKGYGFRFNNLPQGNCRSTIDKLLRVLDHFNVRIPLKRITISSEIPISTKHFSFIELSLFMLLYILKYLDISNRLSSILFLGRVDLHGIFYLYHILMVGYCALNNREFIKSSFHQKISKNTWL